MTLCIDTQAAQPKRSSKNDLFSVNFKAVSPHVRTTPESSPTPSNRSSWQSDVKPNRWRSPSRSARASFSTDHAAQSPVPTKAIDLPTELIDFVIPQDIGDLHSEPFNFRLCPARTFLLGVGRHSSVYLASYRNASAKWKLCAGKRVDRDKEAYADALREAYIMARLSSNDMISNNHIARLIGVRQEMEADDWHPELESESNSRRSSTANSIRSIGLGLSNSSSSYSPTDQIDPSHATSQLEAVAITRLRNSSSMHAIPSLGRPNIVDLDLANRKATSLREQPSSRSSISDAAQVPPSRIVMLMELCAKGTTAALIRRQPHLVTRSLWLKWAKQISIALCHCHRMGILHADVKSQNIMLSDSLDANLSDFGMSLYLAHASPTDGLGLGTTVYNAPELVQASPQPFGFPADVYAFGVTLNVLLTGHEPFFNCRSPVEQMLWASRGGYWEWETRRKLAACGNDSPGVSSLRMSQRNWSIDSLDSTRSFVRASPSVGSGHRGPSLKTVASLLKDEEGEAMTFSQPVSSLAAEDDSDDDIPASPTMAQRPGEAARSTLQSYSDGSPIQYFLSGKDPVPEGILKLIERMTAREPSARPLMREVVNALQIF